MSRGEDICPGHGGNLAISYECGEPVGIPRAARRNGLPPLLLPQILDGEVIIVLKPIDNRSEIFLEASELEALMMEDVSGPGAAEEGEEAMKKHAHQA
ncbi:hypothetical protein AB8V91_23115 [Archangium violaceum]